MVFKTVFVQVDIFNGQFFIPRMITNLNNISLFCQGEAETSSAGEQLVRNSP